MPTDIAGGLIGTGHRYAIVASRFNGHIVESLVAGALDVLVRHGVEASAVTVVRCPGAWELPLAASALARAAARPNGIIALGCVIRGETSHFDYIAGACCTGLAQVQSTSGIPIGMGVLTCETTEQALARAGLKAGNKGADAASACLEMVNLLGRL